jgi:hypothetical protein
LLSAQSSARQTVRLNVLHPLIRWLMLAVLHRHLRRAAALNGRSAQSVPKNRFVLSGRKRLLPVTNSRISCAVRFAGRAQRLRVMRRQMTIKTRTEEFFDVLLLSGRLWLPCYFFACAFSCPLATGAGYAGLIASPGLTTPASVTVA